jgi:hypothetical protein
VRRPVPTERPARSPPDSSGRSRAAWSDRRLANYPRLPPRHPRKMARPRLLQPAATKGARRGAPRAVHSVLHPVQPENHCSVPQPPMRWPARCMRRIRRCDSQLASLPSGVWIQSGAPCPRSMPIRRALQRGSIDPSAPRSQDRLRPTYGCGLLAVRRRVTEQETPRAPQNRETAVLDGCAGAQAFT